MLSLSRRATTACALLAAAAVAVPVSYAAANNAGTPADKAVASGSKTMVLAPGANTTLMSATFKTSKPTDLLVALSLECSILTNVVLNGGPGVRTETSSAEGRVRAWLELDGAIVPIQAISAPPQDPADQKPGDDSDKVTFCDRVHERTVTDRENEADGIDGSKDYQATKSANAFNWVRLNTGSGDHTLVVKADLSVVSTTGSRAEAVIGNRTLVIEPTKLANAAVIGETGTSGAGG